VSSFIQAFGYDGEGEPPDEHEQPAWLGPPGEELGVATTLNAVVGRSERAAVALTQATSFSNGLTLSFLAQARDLDQRTARTLFHEQHPFGTEEDLPDGFLRLGVELPGAPARDDPRLVRVAPRRDLPLDGRDRRRGPRRGGNSWTSALARLT
jgi:hypothetical protein